MKNLFTIFSLVLLMLVGTQADSFAQEMTKMDKSPLDAAYYPARAPFRAFEKDEEKKSGS